ncbi:hypothetical protein [Celeribacter litoreus]|uniref:hypothetical protein n=1 Tax=Celeribacter litoreus TaxID=2876714 RepID=UPI001CCCC8AF|nr:hypothetical protein [Celeribacter litoreus]MCA0044244.1 hypothetical protein [Celeribacter litoreus]
MIPRNWLLKLVGLILGLCLFGWVILDAVETTHSEEWPALPVSHLVLATGLVVTAHGLHGLAWVIGAQNVSGRIQVLDGVSIYSLSFIARYIPGKVWQIGGISYLAKKRGADPYKIAGYSLVFVFAFPCIGASVMLISYFVDDLYFGWIICLTSVPVLALLLSALFSLASEGLVSFLPKYWRDRLRSGLNQPFWALYANLLLLALVWLGFGTSGHVLLRGFAPDWSGSWTQSTTATIGGLIAGFLVLIAPSGAGVREATTSVWLTHFGVSPIVSIAFVITLRITMTLSEFLWAGLGAFVLSRSNKEK